VIFIRRRWLSKICEVLQKLELGTKNYLYSGDFAMISQLKRKYLRDETRYRRTENRC